MSDGYMDRQEKETKLGMKPRSQRDRKRPRTNSKHQQQESLSVKSRVLPLQLNGQLLSPLTYIRVIEPYPYTYSTFAKARWIGRSLLDVYCTEFGSYPPSYYSAAISQGKIQVSGQTVDFDYAIKGQHVLEHTVHRHEPAVLVSSPGENFITIVAETDELLVVDKPSTLPVHPCGTYYQNSLTPILEPRYGKLHILHRLDRLTSGIVLLAKSSEVAQRWGRIIMGRGRDSLSTCEKVYLARVKGKFPLKCPLHVPSIAGTTIKYGEYQLAADSNKEAGSLDAQELRVRNALGFWLSREASLQDVFDSRFSIDQLMNETNPDQNLLWLHLACPTRISSHKDGICEAGGFADLDDEVYLKSVKPAQTSFAVVRYDDASDSTVLICRPETGRTHQIRLHLRFLGHAIANDPCYGGELWYGDENRKKACEEASLILRGLQPSVARTTADCLSLVSDTPAAEEEIAALAKIQREESDDQNTFIRKTCVWCARSGANSNGNETEMLQRISDRDMLEFLIRSQGIWLHALRYKLTDSQSRRVIDFCTQIPPWG